MRLRLLFSLCAAAMATPLHAQTAPDDPNIWLETVSNPRVDGWVASHNAATAKVLTSDPRYQPAYDTALALAGASDRIAMPEQTHGAIFNFWTDAAHPRGILRQTTLADYRTATPQWRTVLDIDALGKAEGKSWVYKGINCLEPEERRCLVSLSDGGEDAVEIREFDLVTNQFVAGGFHLPRGKHYIAWQDENHLLVATEWAPGELTASGYPFAVKRLARGAALADAAEVYHGSKEDGGYGVTPSVWVDGQGERLALITRPLDTFRSETWVVSDAGARRLAIPEKAGVVGLLAGHVIVQIDEDWAPKTGEGAGFQAGSLVDLPLADVRQGAIGTPRLIYAAGPRQAIDSVAVTRNRLLVSILDNVRGLVLSLAPGAGAWSSAPLGLPRNSALAVASTELGSDRVFASATGFLTPSTLYLADAASGRAEPVKTLPDKFDASRDVVEQFEAASSDGTKIPYFVVHRKDIAYDGTTPTLLNAYGGFQISETPSYSASIGKLWLEQGGAYVLANIRGGGEFGPKWHEAGVGVKRQIIYDDFAAVARDLAARKITSPRRLGIYGGSNGGLLMGVELTQHPELWNAVVIMRPLLDMIRIDKIAAGASWQGEYGDVNADPAVMAFWLKTSPYAALRAGVAYPAPLILTSTKDDRTGPGHARKFAARMEQLGLPNLFYESTEGGHSTGADLKQQAQTSAMMFTYLYQRLID